MMRSISRCLAAVLSIWVVLTATMASAQVIGTFRWQFTPYCNVVTLTVSQVGPAYRLEGDDDLCGAPVHASVNGTAHLNPNGTVSMGLTMIRPDGITVQNTVSLSFPALTGTWADDFGNSGIFAFSAPSPSTGEPRRATLRGDYAVVEISATDGGGAVRSISFGRTLPTAPRGHFVAKGSAPTADCPGTAAAPEAASGHLCVYEMDSLGVPSGATVRDISGSSTGFADRWGALLEISGPGTGMQLTIFGTWAVTP